MSQTWQTVLSVCGGLVIGWFLIRLGKKPRWSRVVDLFVVLFSGYVAVLIGLGHFDRLDAIWPALTGLLILAKPRDGARPARQPGPAEPDDGGFLHDGPPVHPANPVTG